MVRKQTDRPEAKLEAAFLALSQQTPDRRPTLLELVETHRDWIAKLVGQGHSYNRIAEAMSDKGYKISQHTLRQYFAKLEREQTRISRPGRAVKIAPSPAATGNTPLAAATQVGEARASAKAVEPTSGRFKPVLPGETEL